MIEARRRSVWGGRYDLLDGGLQMATWEPSTWGTGGTLRVDGRRLRVRSNVYRRESTAVDPTGTPVAVAREVGRRNWTIEADGMTYHFRSSTPWRHEEKLRDGGRSIGRIRRTGLWRGDAQAELPSLPRMVAAFAVSLTVSRWESEVAATG